MKYKNIVFDFGNVIGRFNGKAILSHFCSTEDCELLAPIVYEQWAELDRGTIAYEEYIEYVVSRVPSRLEAPVRKFFRDWPEYLEPVEDTLKLIDELCERNIPVYLLSNAPTYFAEWAAGYPVLRKFSGIVFSAPLKIAKPDPAIYKYLFETFSLDPQECFFIDDLEKNIAAGKSFGMDGLVFTGNIDKVKAAVGIP